MRGISVGSNGECPGRGPRCGAMLRRWWLVLWSTLMIGGAVAALLLAEPGGAGIRAGIRLTARTSLLLFLAAFTASSIQAFTRGGAGKWLLANRRHLGVSFAASHLLHGGLIVALVMTSAAYRDSVGLGSAGGGAGYLVILALTITSFDRPTRWLGRRRWKLLHKGGVYVLWGIFASVYLPAALDEPLYALPAAALLAALGVRVAARLRAPRRSTAP